MKLKRQWGQKKNEVNKQAIGVELGLMCESCI